MFYFRFGLNCELAHYFNPRMLNYYMPIFDFENMSIISAPNKTAKLKQHSEHLIVIKNLDTIIAAHFILPARAYQTRCFHIRNDTQVECFNTVYAPWFKRPDDIDYGPSIQIFKIADHGLIRTHKILHSGWQKKFNCPWAYNCSWAAAPS